jgi:hypothetical protein
VNDAAQVIEPKVKLAPRHGAVGPLPALAGDGSATYKIGKLGVQLLANLHWINQRPFLYIPSDKDESD